MAIPSQASAKALEGVETRRAGPKSYNKIWSRYSPAEQTSFEAAYESKCSDVRAFVRKGVGVRYPLVVQVLSK